jgi:Na+(H+)/acetate symporter ActP
MKFVTIDGDDIGQKITSAYLNNDVQELVRVNNLVQEKTQLIAGFLRSQGFKILFCAADGVAGSICTEFDNDVIFSQIEKISEQEVFFSVGVGMTLREAYIALLSAKSSGKGRLHDFSDMD